MKLFKKLLSILILSSYFLLVAHAQVKSSLRFAMEATYPPFEYINERGEIEGFDIDIAKALCKQLEAHCSFSNQPWSSLIPSLKLGKFDALISAMAITDQRAKQVAFTQSYYKNSARFVGPKDQQIELSTAGLQHKAIGVQAGTTLESYIHHKYGRKVQVKTYASVLEAFLDLQSGRVNLVLADTPIVKNWLAKQKTNQYQFIGPAITDQQYFGQGFAIAVNKNDQELVQHLNQAIAAIKNNGEYQVIYERYFGQEP